MKNVIVCFAIGQTLDNSKKNIFEKIKLKFVRETIEMTFFVNVKAKIYYDIKHKSLLLNSKNQTFIRFYHEYKFSNQINKKLKSQKCDSFKMIKRVKRFVYEMNLSCR